MTTHIRVAPLRAARRHPRPGWATRGALVVALAWLGFSPARAQSVDVVQTNPDRSALLQPQPRLGFTAGAELPLAVRVDDGIHYQRMDGFGASFTDSSAWLVWTKLTAAQRAQVMRDLFSRRHGIGLNFIRQPMSATDLSLSDYTYNDLPPGQTDPFQRQFSIDHDRDYVIPVLREALRHNPDARVMALPWSPPAWMKSNQALNGGGFDSRYMDALARYFVKFIRAYRRQGIPVHYVAIQNEPLFAGWGYPDEEHNAYESMFMTVDQQAELIGRHLGPALRRADLSTRIIGYEHNWDNTLTPLKLLRDPEAARYTAGIGFHCYAGNREAAHDAVREFFPEKGIWFTECTGVTDFPVFGDNLGWNMHNLIIGATRHWASSVALWNMALDQDSGPFVSPGGCRTCRGVITVDTRTTPSTVTYEVEYYALGHASKFVEPGAYRIHSNFAGPVETVAFRNPDGSIALIGYNSDTTAARTFSVNWRGRVFSYTLPGGAVATFTWDLGHRDFAVSASPGTLTVPAGRDAEFQVLLTRGWPGDVRLSVSGLPPGASARIEGGHRGDAIHELQIDTSASTPAGTYPVTVTGRRGPASHSATVQLTVAEPASPFGGARWAVPGRIEVEAFDDGGEGIAYHDQDPTNNGGQFRPEGVDIESTADEDGAFNVGFTGRGEWLRYSIDVARGGLYNLSARVAVLGGGRNFHVEVAGRDVTGTLTVPDTGWWQNWRTITSRPFRLHAGRQTLRIVFDSDGGNLNWISLQPVAASTPFGAAPIALPGVIQAEDFDAGGAGVGYGDVDPSNNGGQYRTESVDVEATTDEGGGFDVGWTEVGEWLAYTVDIAESRRYALRVRVASMAPGGSFHISVDGRDVTGPINLPGTDGWQNWRTLEIPNVTLPAGRHVMRLVMDSHGYWGTPGNFNWISAE